MLNRVFQFRPCEGPKPGRHSGIPCLDFHIERCRAPCVGAISETEYGEIIDGVIEFLSGETRPIRRELERRMRDAAAEERFEEAARYRNRLFAVESLAQRQAADKRAVGTIDVIGLAVDGRPRRSPALSAPRREDGRSLRVPPRERRRVRTARRSSSRSASSTTAARPRSRPRSSCRPTSRTPRRSRRSSATCAGARVEVRAPQRGEKRRLAELAEENARLALEHDASVTEQKRRRRVEALEELRESLNLESLPTRIECFDVSNIQGREIVASMAVFVDAQPRRAPLPHVRRARARGPGRLRGDGAGRVAPLRAAARRGVSGALRRELRARSRTSS